MPAEGTGGRHKRLVVAVEADFQRESADPAWSFQATTRLQEAMAQAEFAGVSARNVDCRSQMCRMDVACDNPGPLKEFTASFPRHVAQTLSSIVFSPTDDTSTMTLYLFREGYEQLSEPTSKD